MVRHLDAPPHSMARSLRFVCFLTCALVVLVLVVRVLIRVVVIIVLFIITELSEIEEHLLSAPPLFGLIVVLVKVDVFAK